MAMFSRSLRKAIPLLLGLMAAQPAWACTVNPPQQPKGTFPHLTGKLLLQWHKTDAQGNRIAGSGQIGMYNFSQKQYYSVSRSNWPSSWGITDPASPVFSPDGQRIYFTGITKGGLRDIYVMGVPSQDSAAPNPAPVTHSDGSVSYENPRVSTDGKFLVAEEVNTATGVHAIVSLQLYYTQLVPNGRKQITYPAPGTNDVAPAMRPDGRVIYYTHATTGGPELNYMVLYPSPFPDAGPYGFRGQAANGVVRSDGFVLYNQFAAGSPLSRLYGKISPSDPPLEMAFNDCRSSNSDAAPVNGTAYAFFASTQAGPTQLYLGNYYSGERWNLSLFGLNADVTVVYKATDYK